MSEPLFAALALLLVVGVGFDCWFGNTIGWRKWLHAGLIVLFLLVMGSIPSCGRGGNDGLEIDEPPYRF